MVPLDRQVQALLDLVEADRARKCEAILGEAKARADALLLQAHAEARSRMREAFAEERQRRDGRIAAARANLQTRQRLAQQQRAAAFLAAGWQRLPAALLACWTDPAARRMWVDRVTNSARAVLPKRAWRIVHAADWPPAERDALARELGSALGTAPAFVSDPSLRAGLKIAADGNVIDGTQEGLLADRAEIGAMLLDELEGEGAEAAA